MKYVGENALKKWTSLVKSDIKKKLDKNQGTANSGKILGVDASGEVAPTDTEVATLMDVPNGIVKGDGSTLSVAVAGTDYMAPVTGGTTGQVLTKTANGQEWQDREKDLFVVTISGDDSSGYTANKTFSEIKAAYDEGKTVVAITVVNSMTCPLFLVYIADELVQFTAALFNNMSATLSITMDKNNNIARELTYNQVVITASGLLKGDGIGGVSAATAGTDYVAPNGDASNVTAAFTTASTRANIATGEKLSVLFGKVAKWFADLGSLAFKNTVAKSDLASDVQTSLRKADTALQRVNKIDIDLGNVENERQYSSANPPPYPVTSVNGKTGAVTVESSSGTTYNATLSSSGWTTSGSYKKQTITVTGLKANYPVAPVVDAQLTGTDADGDTAVLTGFSAINLIQTAANQLIAYCIGDAPTVNIPLIINTWG